MHFRSSSSTQPSTENHENRPTSSRSSISVSNIPKDQLHLMPAPLRPASGGPSSVRPLRSSRDPNGEAPLLQPSVYKRPEASRSAYTLQPKAYTRPQPRRSASPLQNTSYPRSQPPSAHHSARTHTEQQFDQPPLTDPPLALPDNSAVFANEIMSSSSAPVSPWSTYDATPWPQSSNQAPRITVNNRKSTFTDPHEFGLFAEALSGVGPGPIIEPMSQPQISEPPAPPPPQFLVSPISPDEASYFMSRPAGNARTSGTYPPPVVAAHALPAMPDLSTPPSMVGRSFQSARTQPEVQQDVALSGAMLGLDLNESVPRDDDDELPDYEQSQREAAEQARIKASNRAAELESRWAASAPHRRGR